MNIIRTLRYSLVLVGLLTLSACAGASGPSVASVAPSSSAPVAEVAPKIPLSSADKLGLSLVGTKWEDIVDISNCNSASVTLNFVYWATNEDLMRVLASSEDCPVLQGGFLGTIRGGSLAVRSFDKQRRIFLTPNMESGVAPGRIELGNAKTGVTFRQIKN